MILEVFIMLKGRVYKNVIIVINLYVLNDRAVSDKKYNF